MKPASYLDMAKAVRLIELGFSAAGDSELLKGTDQETWPVAELKKSVQGRISKLYSEITELNDMLGQGVGSQQESKLLVSPGTPLACTSCHRIEMPSYYMKRSNGKYDVLCFDNGNGCWERSGAGLCNYIDRDEAQCMDLAEWVVVYGPNTDLSRRCVCSRHIPAVLGNASEYRIYPLDDPNKAQNYTS